MRHKRLKGRRARRGNPFFRKGMLGTVTAGFKVQPLTDAAIMAGGALGNVFVRNWLTALLPAGWQRIGSYAIGLSTAGLMMMVPKVGHRLFAGALTGEVLRGAYELAPAIGFKIGDYAQLPLAGFNEFATTGQRIGMGEYAEIGGGYQLPEGVFNEDEIAAQSQIVAVA